MTLTGLLISQAGIMLFFLSPGPPIRVAMSEVLRCTAWLVVWYFLMMVTVIVVSLWGNISGPSVLIAINAVPPLLAWVIVTLVGIRIGLIAPVINRALVLVRASTGLAFWGGLVLPSLALDQPGGQEAAIVSLAVVLAGPAFALLPGRLRGRA